LEPLSDKTYIRLLNPEIEVADGGRKKPKHRPPPPADDDSIMYR
jgi:hypothetical protein